MTLSGQLEDPKELEKGSAPMEAHTKKGLDGTCVPTLALAVTLTISVVVLELLKHLQADETSTAWTLPVAVLLVLQPSKLCLWRSTRGALGRPAAATARPSAGQALNGQQQGPRPPSVLERALS